MVRNNATTVEEQTPISDSTIEAVANNLRIDEDAVRSLLDYIQSDVAEYDLVDEFDELHEFIGQDNGIRVYLATHATEVDELASHAGWDADVDLPEDVSRAEILRQAMDSEAKGRFADLFGGKQDAADATGSADALIVATSEE